MEEGEERREGGGGASGENGRTETETEASQEVQGEDLQRGTPSARSPRGQSVEREAHGGGSQGWSMSQHSDLFTSTAFQRSPPTVFSRGGSFITFMTGEEPKSVSVFRGYRLHLDAGAVQTGAKKLVLPSRSINIIHE